MILILYHCFSSLLALSPHSFFQTTQVELKQPLPLIKIKHRKSIKVLQNHAYYKNKCDDYKTILQEPSFFRCLCQKLYIGQSWLDTGTSHLSVIQTILKKIPHADITLLPSTHLTDSPSLIPSVTCIQYPIEYINRFTTNHGQNKQFDVLTDLFGCFSYTNNLTHLIELYAQSLKPEGILFIAFETNRLRFLNQVTPQHFDLQHEWVQYILSFSCFKLLKAAVYPPSQVFIFEKTNQPVIPQPHLKIHEIKEAYRTFGYIPQAHSEEKISTLPPEWRNGLRIIPSHLQLKQDPKLKNKVQYQRYHVGRNLTVYAAHYIKHFALLCPRKKVVYEIQKTSLEYWICQQLKQKKSWLDSGAGFCNAAEEALQKVPNGDITVITKDTIPSLLLFSYYPHFNFIQEWIEHINDIEICGEKKRFDIITDIYGAFSYTSHLSYVLNLYSRLLKIGGTLHLIFYEYSMQINEIKEDGIFNPIDIIDYISSFSCFKIIFQNTCNPNNFNKGNLNNIPSPNLHKVERILILQKVYSHQDLPPLTCIRTEEMASHIINRNFTLLFQSPSPMMETNISINQFA